MSNCSHSLLTLIHLTSFPIHQIEHLTTIKLINSCLQIDIKTIEKLPSIRRLIFSNCTIEFIAREQYEDYAFYPRNLSYWLFQHGRTNSFNQFMSIINHLGYKYTYIANTFSKYLFLCIDLGPFKFDLHLSDCFSPVYDFNHFHPLHHQFVFLNITCEHFQIDAPASLPTRTAIYLTPTMIINTKSNICPSEIKYRWLNFKSNQRNFYPIRIFICENRLIEFNFDFEQQQTTIDSHLITIQSSLSSSSSSSSSTTTTNTTTIFNRWTLPILINFSAIFLIIFILFVACLVFLIRVLIR